MKNTCLTKEGLDLQWLEEKLPYIPVNLLKDVVDLTHRHGKEALGVFTNGVIELAKNTPKGVEYHEAFHAVFNSYLSEDQRNKILDEASKKYGIKRSYDNNSSSPKFKAIDYTLKAVDTLQSDKAKQIFEKGAKAKWDLNKILTELAVPKEQKQLILDLSTRNREDIITNLLTNYSYAVEINTATKVLNNPKYEYDEFGEGFQIGEELVESKADFYSDLTVPGGTNYTENEISTPLITPSIKGHAQFSTDNGIGWFRSDEQTIKDNNPDYDKQATIKASYSFDERVANYFNFEEPFVSQDQRIQYLKETDNGNYIKGSKTRRILEVQSDLFQKGRNKENLSVNYNTFTEEDNIIREITKNEYDKVDSKEEYIPEKINEEDGQLDYDFYIKKTKDGVYIKHLNSYKGEYYNFIANNKKKHTENQFLQLLNKDNNWVTFFVKSIIQDSAKKGYEKVLFPTGNTASKVEGHSTLEEFKKQKENAIVFEENKIKEYDKIINTPLTEMEDLFGKPELYKTKENKQKSLKYIDQLKQELERVETEGFGALRPIYNFYENTVTNILKKQGYNPTLITDEYGNTWQELTITDKIKNEVIRLKSLNQSVYNTGDLQLEEKLADDFSDYIRFKIPSKSSVIQDFFNKLKFWIKEKLGLITINDLYKAIDDSYFANKKPIKTNISPKFKEPIISSGDLILLADSAITDILEAYKTLYKLDTMFDLNIQDISASELVSRIDTWFLAQTKNNTHDIFKSLEKPSIKKDLFNLIKDKLLNYNIALTIDEESQQALTIEQKENPEIYDKAELEKAWDEKISNEMRLYLSTRIDKDKNNKPKLNKFGKRNYIPIQKVKADLVKDLSDIMDSQLMEYKLEELSKNKPYYTEIVSDLVNYRGNFKINVNDRIGTVYTNKFNGQFFNLFQGPLLKLMTTSIITSEYERVIPNSNQTEKTRTINSFNFIQNDAGVNNYIKQSWLAQGKEIPSRLNLSKESVYNSISVRIDNNLDNLEEMIDELIKNLGLDIKPELLFKAITPTKGKNKGNPDIKELKQFFYELFVLESNNTQVINKVAREHKTMDTNYSPDIITGADGTSRWVKQSYNYLRKFFQLKKDYEHYSTILNKDGFASEVYSNTVDNLFSKVRQNKFYNHFTYRTFDNHEILTQDSYSVTNKEGDKESYSYSSMNDIQFEISKLVSYIGTTFKDEFDNIHDSDSFVLPTITPSDSGNNVLLKGQKLTENQLNDLIYKDVLAEFERIKSVRVINTKRDQALTLKATTKDPNVLSNIDKFLSETSIGNYFINGKYFVHYPTLNDKLDQYLAIGEIPFDDVIEILRNEVKNSIQDYVNKGLLIKTVNPEGGLANISVPDGLYPDYVYEMKEPQLLGLLSRYFKTIFYTNLYTSKLMVGDIAFYKSAENKQGNFDIQLLSKSLLTDASKRAKQTITPSKLLDNLAVSPTFNIVVQDDPKGISENLNIYERLFPEISDMINDKYKGIDIADAQGLGTLDRILEILQGLGEDGEGQLKAITKLINNESLTQEEYNLAIQPVKGFVSGLIPRDINIPSNDFSSIEDIITTIVPTQVKYSLLPLIPQFTSQFPDLDKLRIKMEKDNIQEYTFKSAVKNGIMNLSSQEDIDSWLNNDNSTIKSMEVPNFLWGKVMEVPYKDTTSEKFSTQKQRLITANIDEETYYPHMKMNGKELVDDYHNTIKNILNKQLEAFKKKIFSGDTLDANKLKDFIKSEMMKKDQGLLNQTWDSILNDLNKDNLYMLDLPQHRDKIYSLVASAFDKTVMDIKLTGKSAVLASTFKLFNKSEVGINNELRASTLINKDSREEEVAHNVDQIYRELKNLGIEVPELNPKELLYFIEANNIEIVTADEIIVTPAYFIKQLKKKGLDPNKFLDNNGNFNLDALPESLKYVSFHRIPLQAKNSVARGYITKFSQVNQGTVIYFNPDSLVRSGGDFDIDKVYMEFYDFNSSFKGLKNWLITEKGIDKSLLENYDDESISEVLELEDKDDFEAYISPLIQDYYLGKDYLDQDVFKGFKKKKNDNNRIIDIHNTIMSNPAHYKEMTVPNHSETVKEMAKYFRKLNESKQNVKTNNWWSNIVQSKFRNNNLVAKDLIGQYSIYNVLHAINQYIKPTIYIKDNNSFTVFRANLRDKNGNITQPYLDKLGNKFDLVGNLVSDNNAEYQTATVDNAKDPILGDLNHSMFTSSLKMMLTHIGLPIQVIERLTNNDIFLDYTTYYNYFKLTENESKSKSLALAKISSIYKVNTEDVLEFDLTDINKDMLGMEDKFMKQFDVNEGNKAKMVNTLKLLFELSDSYNDYAQGLRLSNNGVANNLYENLRTIDNHDNKFFKNSNFVFDVEAYNNSMYKTYRDLFEEFIKATKPFNSNHGEVFSNALKIAESKGIKLYNYKDYRNFYQGLVQFLSNTNNKIGTIASTHEFKNLLYSTYKPLQEYKSQLQREGKKNVFIESLMVFEDQFIVGEGNFGIKYNNSSESPVQINDIITGVEQLSADNPELLKKLMFYGLRRYGWGAIKSSYMKFIPLDLQERYGIIEHWKKLKLSDNNNPVGGFLEEFVLEYAKNNPDKLTYAKKDQKLLQGNLVRLGSKKDPLITYIEYTGEKKVFKPYTLKTGLEYFWSSSIFDKNINDNNQESCE